MNTLGSAETLATLGDGCVRTASSDLLVQLSASTPVSFDFHWLRSLGSAILGSTGIRIDAAADAHLSVALRSRCSATVQRQDRAGQPWLRLSIERDRTLLAAPSLVVHVTLPSPQDPDPLTLAISGVHPRQRLRNLLKSIGGSAVSAFLELNGISSGDFSRLAALWPSLTSSAEPVLWRAAQSAGQVNSIARFTHWLASSCPSPLELHQCLQSPEPVLSRWFEALCGTPASSCLPDSAFRAAQSAARICLPLLDWPELPSLLQHLSHAIPPLSIDALDAAPSTSELARRLYDAAGPALARTLSADLSLRLSARAGSGLVLDAAFRLDEAGLDLYRRALAGEFTRLLAGSHPSVEVYDAAFGPTLLRRRNLELHLPFLASSSRAQEVAAISGSSIISTADGRLSLIHSAASARKLSPPPLHNEQHCRWIMAASLSSLDREPVNDNFSLTFSDIRRISAWQDNHHYLQMLSAYGIPNPVIPPAPALATFSLALPGTTVQDWSRVPVTRAESLAPILARISLALQAALRRWLPVLFFANPERFGAPALAIPLLAYQCSRPFARVGLRQYSYDAMDPASVDQALYSALPRLKAPLARIQALLSSAGKPALAARYSPESLPAVLRSVLDQQRHFAALLAADAFFIEQVLALVRYNRDLTTVARRNPTRTPRDLRRFTSDFLTVFHRRLSRLYGPLDCTALGSLLLMEATAALSGRRDCLHATWVVEPAPPDTNA